MQHHHTFATRFRARSLGAVLAACSATNSDCLHTLWKKIINPQLCGFTPGVQLFPLSNVSSCAPSIRALACQAAILIVSHNSNKPPPTAFRRLTLRSWNLTSLHDLTSFQASRKIDLLRRLVTDSVTLLQETGWDRTQPRALMQSLGTFEIASSPAVETCAGGRSGGVAIILPTYTFGRISQVTEVIPGYALLIRAGPVNDPFHILNVYLRPGEQTSLLARITRKLCELLPTGRLYIGGDFNMDLNDERLRRFMGMINACNAVEHSGTPNRFPSTFKNGQTTGTEARRSSIDHWLIRDPELNAGRKSASLVIRFPRLADSEHAIVTVTLKPVKESAGDYPDFVAVPTSALQSRSAVQSLERELAGITPTCDPTSDIRLATATIWAWFRGQGQKFYQPTFKDAWKEFFKASRSTAPTVVVRRAAFECARAIIEIPCEVAELPSVCDDRVRVSAALAREIAQRLDMHVAICRTSQTVHQVHQAVLGKKSAPVLWKRIKAISPKFENSLQAMERKDGTLTSDPSEISKSLLSTRDFWTKRPEPLPDDVASLIMEYSAECFHFPEGFKPPPKEFYTKVIINTGDSAPGIDGIPYAALRADPELFAQLLVNYTEATTLGHQGIHPGHQLLVWIAKGNGGTKADCWRPLGMPTTLMRTHSAAAYKWIAQNTVDLLHPAQALMNRFREPQGNFIWMQDWLFEKNSHLNLGVALTDMVKAFELINPEYLVMVLAALKAPLWLIKYATLVLFGRKVIPKIKGKLTEFFALLVGVDMGSAFSGMLFCIGLDPVIRAANRIPGVISVRGYMDDNATALRNLLALALLQRVFIKFQPAGLLVKQHTCCFFRPSDKKAFEPNKSNCPIRNGDSHRPPAGFSSWRKAAKEALRRWPLVRYFNGGQSVGLQKIPRALLRLIAQGKERKLFPTLCMQSCQCGCKTFLVVTAPIKIKRLIAIDRLPWGAKILSVSATYLGLPMKSPVSAWWMPRKARSMRRKIKSAQEVEAHKKADSGVNAIIARVRNTLSPLPTRAAYASMLAQSKHYYPASVFPASKKTTARLQGDFARIILRRKWVASEVLQGLLREVGIAPGPDVRTALIAAYVGLRLRMYGSLKPAYDHPVRADWWQVKVFLDEIASHSDPIAQAQNQTLLELSILQSPAEKVKSTIKFLGKERARSIAQMAIADATASILWKPTHANGVGTIGRIKSILLQPMARIAILKWNMDRETDSHWRLVIAGGTRRRPVQPTNEIGACHPFGMSGPTFMIDEVNFAQPLWILSLSRVPHKLPETRRTKTISAAILKCLSRRNWHSIAENQNAGHEGDVQAPCFFRLQRERADFLDRNFPIFNLNAQEESLPDTRDPADACPLCGMGDASVEHWTCYCWVTNLALSVFIGKLATTIDWELGGKSEADIMMTAHVAATARRRLVSLGAIGKESCHTVGSATDSYREFILLVSETRGSLPLVVCDEANLLCALPFTMNMERCNEADIAYVWGRPTRHLQGIRRRMIKPLANMSATANLSRNDTILSKHGDNINEIWHIDRFLPPPIFVAHPDQPNASITVAKCSCGRSRIVLRAATDISCGSPIHISRDGGMEQTDMTTTILVQFDGSCDGAGTGLAHSGAGVVAYLLAGGERTVIAKERHPLPHVKSAPHAEAHGALFACIAAIRERESRWQLGDNPKVIIQGDNSAAIGYMNHESSVKAGEIQTTLREAWIHASRQLSAALFEYIPREINKVADALAVEARKNARAWIGSSESPLPEILRVSTRGAGAEDNSQTPGPTGTEVALWEKPLISSEDMRLLQKDNDGTYDELLPTYLLQAHAPGEVACTTTYIPKTSNGDGRLYAARGSIQSLSRKARNIVLQKHHEYDMVAAHLAIFIALTNRTSDPILERPNELKEEIISNLKSCGATTDDANTFARAFLNMEPQAIPGLAARAAMFAGGCRAVRAAQGILEHKDAVLKIAEADGFDKLAYANYNDKNALYFALEFYEARIMRDLVGHIARARPESMVWIHDGLFISDDVPRETVFHAFEDAASRVLRVATAFVQIAWTPAGTKHSLWRVEAMTTSNARPPDSRRLARARPPTLIPKRGNAKRGRKPLSPNEEQAANERSYWTRKGLVPSHA